MNCKLERLVGQVRSTDTPLQVGDIIKWDEWWDHKPAWAKIIEVSEGMTTTHFRVRFEDAELERINQEDQEWFRCRHLSGAVVYLPNMVICVKTDSTEQQQKETA